MSLFLSIKIKAAARIDAPQLLGGLTKYLTSYSLVTYSPASSWRLGGEGALRCNPQTQPGHLDGAPSIPKAWLLGCP